MTGEHAAVPQEARTAQLPFEVASVTAARALVTDELVRTGAPRHVVEDVNLVVGELVMNGVRHGRPTEAQVVELAWWYPAEDVLRFSVCDGGSVDHLEARMPDPLTPGGRGLAIVDRLCRSWTFDTARGTRVTADIPLV